MNNDLQIYEGQEIVPVDIVKELARRLEATYVQPSDVKAVILPKEFETVVELAIADGHNPLSKTFYFWKYNNKLFITGAYTNLVNWAQKIEPHTVTYEMISVGRKEQWNTPPRTDFLCRAWLLKRGDQQAYQERFDSIMKYRQPGESLVEIIKQAKVYAQELCFMGEGLVKWDEIFYGNSGNIIEQPKGWVPGETRAQRRALKNAIRQAFGEPSPGERKALSLAAVFEAKRFMSVPKEVVRAGQASKFIEAENEWDSFKERTAEEAREKGVPEPIIIHEKRLKNVEAMRGFDSIRDDILGDAEEAVFEEQKPFDFTTRMDAVGYGSDTKIKKLSKALFQKGGIEELSELEKWNMYQWAIRRQLLVDGEGLDARESILLIPELIEYKGDKLVEARNLLNGIVREMTATDRKLKELTFEYQ
jgi:hypothetical protein